MAPKEVAAVVEKHREWLFNGSGQRADLPGPT